MRQQNLKSQHIAYVEVELWNFKSQNIPCAEADLHVTEYSRCGISLVPCAMVRKTWERRAACPWVKVILVMLLLLAVAHTVFFFLRYYQAVTSKFSEFMSPALYFLSYMKYQ